MPFKCVVPGCRSNYYHVKGTASVPMIRYPSDPEKIKAWSNAICRPGFMPTQYSHVCIKHFRDDQMVATIPPGVRVTPPWGTSHKTTRRLVRLRLDAVPCVFAVDPSTHKMRPCYRPKKRTPVDQRRKECEILAGMKVEFKPEMWEENGEKTEEAPSEPPVKRGRGRPRKHVNNNNNTKANGNVVVKSEVVSCCALACTNTSENFTMNSLPQDPALRKLWVEKIDRLDWSPDEDSALCEIHFDGGMWEMDVGSEKILKSDAVPSQFLHGEAIKSWVTMDNTGNIANIVVDGHSTNDENSINGDSNHGNMEESMDGCLEEVEEEEEEGDPTIFVKREVLEPEIDMVEGSEEDIMSREASTGEQFETIYCDSTFNDHEDSEDEQHKSKEDEDSPMIIATSLEENPFGPDERSSSPILQDGEVSCLEDSTKKSADVSVNSKYLVISMASKDHSSKEKIIKRRSSNQLTDEFQCPICDRRLSRRKNLEIHIEKLHPYGEMSEYQKKRKEEQLIAAKREEAMKAALKKPAFKKPPPPLKPIIPQCLLSPSIPTIPVIPLNTQNSLTTPSALTSPEGVLTTSFPIISFSSQSPLVSSSIQTTPSTMVTPTLVAPQPLITSQPLVTPTALIASPNLVASSSAGTLLTTPSIVTTPRPLDPSPAGGEMRKQFLLLLPTNANKQAVISPPPLSHSPKPPTPKPSTPIEQPSAASDESALYTVNLGEIPLDKRLKLKDKLRELVDAVVKKNLNPEKIIIAYDRT